MGLDTLALLAASAVAAAPAPPPQTAAVPEIVPLPLVSFDPDRVEVVWADRRWQLVCGSTVLKDFGRREAEARQAHRLVRDLRLNQHGTIGRPAPVLEFWLCDGRAPRGPVSGLRDLTFNPAALQVEPAGGQWCLGEGSRVLFRFGPYEEDARQALAVIRAHGFTRLGIVGQATPSMLVFLADEHVPGPRLPRPPAPREAAYREAAAAKAKEAAVRPIDPSAGLVPTAAVPPLRPTARPAPGPRELFFGGTLTTLPSGRRLGASPPPADIARLAQRVPFEADQVQTRRDRDDWLLVYRNQTLARFAGPEEAQQALQLVQHYGLTDRMVVGRPGYFSYYLAGGRPPRGVPLGVAARAFQPDGLVVRAVAGRWCICDNDEPLLTFGSDPAEARAFLELIRQERLNRLCVLGASPQEGMTLLIRAL